MSRSATGPALTLLLVAATACGARSTLEGEAAAGGAGPGGAGGASPGITSVVGVAAGPTATAASTGTGVLDCEPRNLDPGGEGAIVLRTEGELAFYTTADGRVMRGDLETGEERVLAASREALGDLALFEGALYFTDQTGISRVPLDGGAETSVVALDRTTYAIAVDATGVYWVDGPSNVAGHTIQRQRPDGTRVEVATGVQYPLGLSVGPLGVAFTDPYDFNATAGTVRLAGIEGGPSQLVAQGVSYPEYPFQRDGYLYWIEASDEQITNNGGIFRAASDGSAYQEMMPFVGQYPVWAMTDGAYYFATVLDEDIGSHLIAATYPLAGAQTVVASATEDEFFTVVATTPKRIVWTVQVGSGATAPVDGVRSVCRGAVLPD